MTDSAVGVSSPPERLGDHHGRTVRKKMRIAYVIDELDCGGAEQQLVTLCVGLRQRDHDVHVISVHDSLELRKELDDARVPIRVARRHGRYDLSVLWRLRQLIGAIDPDVVHAYLPTACLLAPLTRWIGVRAPVLQSERGINDWRSPLRLRLENIVRANVAHITCNADAIKRHLVSAERVPADHITVIHNGIRPDRRGRPADPDLEQARQTIGAPPDATIAICVANFSPVKQHHVLVRAVAEARARGGSLFLVLVGRGPLEGLIRRQIQEMGLEGACRVITDCRNPKALVSVSHVALLVSQLEGCSNALLEAMALGLPVIASDAGGNRELVTDGRGGYLCPVGDASSVARSLMTLASDPSTARHMGQYNLRQVAERFTDDIMVDRSLALYETILRNGGGHESARPALSSGAPTIR